MTETPQNPPPGFYPDQNGVQRYWDGNAWTDQVQQAASSTPAPPLRPRPATSPSASTSASGGSRPWFKKKRYLIPLALVAVLFIAGIAGEDGGSGDKEPTAAAAKAASDSDNDGVTDDKDAFPSDPAETEDDNGNGVGDVADAKAAKAEAAAEKAAEKKAAQAAKDKRKKKIANAKFVSQRDLALVFKDPDSHKGELFQVWGEVTQFDAATGTDAFLAATAHADTRSYGYFDGESAFFQGKEGALSKLVEDDIFTSTVEVTGSLSYDTQIGGNTTVPQFKVLKIKRR